jgi:hypothetical protein
VVKDFAQEVISAITQIHGTEYTKEYSGIGKGWINGTDYIEVHYKDNNGNCFIVGIRKG